MRSNDIYENYSQITIFPPLKKLILMEILTVILILIGIFNLQQGLKGNKLMIVLGVTVIVFFGFCFIYIFKRIIYRRPSLIIDSNGITDNASAVGVGFIAWYEVRKIILYEYSGKKTLGIVVYDVDSIQERLTGLKRAFFKSNRIKIFGAEAPINIQQNMCEMKLEDIKNIIENYHIISPK